MNVTVSISVPISSNDIDRHRGNLLAAIEENIDMATVNKSSLESDELTWHYESNQEYAEADTPGTPLYRFHRGEAWPK